MTHHSEGEWSAVLLQTADELSEEGRLMHHCVSSYSKTCKTGCSRIFSVRLNGERVSTLEFKLKNPNGTFKAYDHNHPSESDHWAQTQNGGKCNVFIADPSALAFCKAVGEKLNAHHLAWVRDLAIKRSLIAQQAAVTRKANIKLG